MSEYAPPPRITLICHPATPQQKAGCFPADEPLDSRSLEQLSAIAWDIPQNALILTAPERRTRQTAEALGLNAIDAPELRECDFGRWSGVDLETLQAEDPAGLSEWLSDIAAAPHQGESFYNLITRISGWLDARRSAGHVVAVTHASVVRAAIVQVVQAPPHEAFQRIEIAPLTVTEIRLSGGRWRVRSVGVPLIGGRFGY
jgi:broad specificity phosphatase PhoE